MSMIVAERLGTRSMLFLFRRLRSWSSRAGLCDDDDEERTMIVLFPGVLLLHLRLLVFLM